MFTTTLQTVLADLAIDDLISDDELVCPSEATLVRLQQIADAARAQRLALLQERRTLGHQPTVPSGQLLLDLDGNARVQERAPLLDQRSHEALFLAKRAQTLRALLAARLVIAQLPIDIASIAGLRTLISSERGRQATQTLVRENKKRKVGINIMDIIVCGAIPPYNIILGGKLISMLIVGPKVIYDYHQKYREYTSHIASQMKQDRVFRNPDLVFLGTTSLYHVGSSQYNRISIPVDGNGTKISYTKYGKTIGFGSVHFSSETIQTLNSLQANVKEAILINNRFGEGVNPKLRRVSAGLSDIGLENSDRFTNHRSKRILYGIPLGRSAYAYLRRETEDPGHFFNVTEPSIINSSMKYIAEHWSERWLLMRIKNASILQQLILHDIGYILLSSVLDCNHVGVEISQSCETLP
jgi:Druantia protein DruA